MPKGHYDRSKAKARAKKADAGAPDEQATETGAKAAKQRGRRKAAAVKPKRAVQAKAALGSRRFGRWDDGSIDINLPCCSGHLSAEEGKELQAFLAGVRGK